MGDDGVRSSLNAGDLLNIPYPVAPADEKKRIVAFLDRKCAEIDAVVERTKATIEEYKKLKQAVITEAVTKGVRGPRKMKDSGIEWAKRYRLSGIASIRRHFSANARIRRALDKGNLLQVNNTVSFTKMNTWG